MTQCDYVEGRVRGMVLWNVWGKLKHVRALIEEPGPYRSTELAGRIGA